MTAKHTVADDVLGKVSRRTWEVQRRIQEGSIDPERTLDLLQWSMEGIPTPCDEGCSWGTYVLEIHWSYDNSHAEFVTIGLEKHEGPPFEELLTCSDGDRQLLMERFRRFQQLYGVMTSEMVRLYRALQTNYSGYNPDLGLTGTVERPAIDVHMILQPICDFDKEGNPIPTKIQDS